MKAGYNHFYFPVALNHVGAGEFVAANECFQLALCCPLTPDQIEHLADLTVIWAMNRPHRSRTTELGAVMDMLATMQPQQPDLARRVMNQVHHAWAFEAYTLRQWPEVGRHVVDTLKTAPALIRDRGLLSIWARSTLERMGFAVARLQPHGAMDHDGAPTSEAVRRRVESLVGETVQGWSKIDSFTPHSPRHHLYAFSDTRGRWIARQAMQGSVQPPAQVMECVAQAGVPVPACRIEQLGAAHVPGLRIESLVEGDSLDLNQHTPQQVAHLVAQLGEAIQRLHRVPAGGFGLLSAEMSTPGDSFAWMRNQLEQDAMLILLELQTGITPAQWIDIAAHAFAMLDESPFAGAAVLCHGDLNPGNILTHKGELAGLIDWELVQGNDPAYDSALFLTFTCGYWQPMPGHAFIEQVVEAFEGKTDSETLRRVSAYLMLCMLSELNLAVRYSQVQPWRDAKQMREFLLATLTQRSLS